MSFIHKFLNDKETPEPVKHLFTRFVSEFENQHSIAWNQEVKQTTNDYHRKNILKQGRCDFDNPPLNLTSEELIVLYNYYYFPMHFQSSYEIYKKLFEEQEEFQNQTFFFHDFGCGTLSSTLAFSACYSIGNTNSSTFKYFNQLDSFNKFNSYYFENGEIDFFRNSEFIMEHQIESSKVPDLIIGYWLNDISKVILTYIINFIKSDSYNGNFSHDYFFNYATTMQGRYSIPIIADKFYVGEFQNPYVVSSNIEPFKSFCNSQHKSTNEITVILNFSYVLASESIEVQNIESIIEEYQETGCKLIIVNQNPDLDSLNTKWEALKNSLTFSNTIKGVQPIKHFGSKSKSRFEVLFIINDKTLDENGDYNIFNFQMKDVEKNLKEKQWVKINEVLKILHRQIHNRSFNYKKYGTHTDNIYAMILNCTLYIEYLLYFIDENEDLDFIYFLISGEEVVCHFRHVNLLLREKLYQNKAKLSNIYFEDYGSFHYVSYDDEYGRKLCYLFYKYGIYHCLNVHQKIDLLLGLDKIDDAKLLLKIHLNKSNQIAAEYDNDEYIISKYSYLLKN